MVSVTVNCRFKCQAGKRDEFLELMRSQIEAYRREPGTLSYYVAIPADSDAKDDVLAFEWYADQQALEAHMASPSLQELRAKIPNLLSTAPVVALCTPLPPSFLNPGLDGGLTILARFTCAPDLDMTDFLARGAILIEESRSNEEGTLSYHWSVAKDSPNVIWALEQYASREACETVHMKSAAFHKAIVQNYASIQGDPIVVKGVLGFLTNDPNATT